MRRAMRHGKKLGLTEPFLHALVDVVVREMGASYPELVRQRDAIVRTVRAEEDRFDAVLTSGLPRLEELLDRTRPAGASVVPGDAVFRLYDSLGVPLDFAEDLAGQRGLVDRPRGLRDRHGGAAGTGARRQRVRVEERRFVRVCERRRASPYRSRSATASRATRRPMSPTPRSSPLFDDGRRQVERLEAGSTGFVVLDRTPFYVESGGQVSDTGQLVTTDGRASGVTGMSRIAPGGARAHRVTASSTLTPGTKLTARVDAGARDATRRNHTATHLLHAALRQRLGTHVRQAGSLVAPDRLRFDFSHFEALTDDDTRDIERVVNEHVYGNTPVSTEVRSTEDAIRDGAMALFGEKYGDRVRVVTVPGFSVELCGGTHVRATGDIGPFVITEESGVAAGVRRIEALTGAGAVAYLQARDAALARTQAALNVPAPEMADAVARLQAEVKRLARENAQLKTKVAMGGPSADQDDSVAIGDAKLVARRVSGLEKDALRGLADSLRDRLKTGVVVLAAENDGKAQLLVSVTKDLTGRVKAGQLVKELAPLIGGGGGGRPDFAEAGGKDPSGIDQVLAKAKELVTRGIDELKFADLTIHR